jgi:hypothetical protein
MTTDAVPTIMAREHDEPAPEPTLEPSATPRRRRTPGLRDDRVFRSYMIGTFWLTVIGVTLLFFTHWGVGVTLLAIALVLFLLATVFG